MEAQKLTKQQLIDLVSQLETDKASALTAANNALAAANYFGSKLAKIEELLKPLTTKKFGKTIIFIITNWKEVKRILNEILVQIQEWRSQVNDMIAKQSATTEA